MLLGVTCPGCGAPGAVLCGGCLERLRPAPSLPRPLGVDDCLALLAYDGPGRELVARLKYRNHRSALGGLAAAMATLVGDVGTLDALTWAPTTSARRRARGVDQAELLARSVARHLGLPARRLLRRAPGPAQTGRSLVERRGGPRFEARAPVPGWEVLVVDDVVTSGATATAAASALPAAGAARWWCWLRRVPLDQPSGRRVYTAGVAYGSVVESRCQSQAKRPT